MAQLSAGKVPDMLQSQLPHIYEGFRDACHWLSNNEMTFDNLLSKESAVEAYSLRVAMMPQLMGPRL